MSDKRSFANFIPPVLLLVGAYWYFSPYLALYSIQHAAKERDVAKLVEYVDLPQVQASIKQQLHSAASVNTYRGPSVDSAAADAVLWIGNAMSDNRVDAIVTPEYVAQVLSDARVTGLKEEKEGKAGDTAPKAGAPVELHWSSERKGADRLDIRATRDAQGGGVSYVLERDGFAGWKIVSVFFPAL